MNLNAYKVSYRGYEIRIKQDFGGQPHLIDGMPCMWGYVVCQGIVNVMPGATWFQTVKDAKRAIDILIAVDGNSDKFWYEYRREAA